MIADQQTPRTAEELSQGKPAAFTWRVPSIYGITCPSCESGDLRVKEAKHGLNSAVFTQDIGGQTTAEVAAAYDAVFDKAMFSIIYQCNHCKKTFSSLPVLAVPDDLLPVPCTIHFERVWNFVGSINPQGVFINGICLMPLLKKQTVTFKTPLQHNTLFVTNGNMQGFKGICSFEAQPGGEVWFRFNRKYLQHPGELSPKTFSYSAYAAYQEQAPAMEVKIGDEWVEKNKKAIVHGRIYGIILAVLLLAVLWFPFNYLVRARDSVTQPYQPPPQVTTPVPIQNEDSAPLTTERVYKGTVREVLDGATLTMTVNGADETVRLIGVEAPLGDDAQAQSTMDYVAGTIGDADVWLVVDFVHARDEQGRMLALVWLNDPSNVDDSAANVIDHTINGNLVRDGYATVEQSGLDANYVDVFKAAQDTAREASLGLWPKGVFE
jgi:micrococcal nuclease